MLAAPAFVLLPSLLRLGPTGQSPRDLVRRVGSGAVDGRVRVRVSAVVRARLWAPEGCSGECLNGMAATRTRRHDRLAGVDAHGEAVAQAWRGKAGCGLGPVHARAQVLVSQGRGVVVPCAGRRHPGPAARRGGGEAMAVAGKWRRVGLLQEKTARRPERDGGPTAGLRMAHRRRR
jgi:hypothetical protein